MRYAARHAYVCRHDISIIAMLSPFRRDARFIILMPPRHCCRHASPLAGFTPPYAAAAALFSAIYITPLNKQRTISCFAMHAAFDADLRHYLLIIDDIIFFR